MAPAPSPMPPLVRALLVTRFSWAIAACLLSPEFLTQRVLAAPRAAAHLAPAEDRSIVPDQSEKTASLKTGEESCTFTFRLTNVSAETAVITDVKPSCGCTIARLPSRPWMIPAGGSGELQLVVDVRGKSGMLVKTATVETRRGARVLPMRINLPAPKIESTDAEARARNRMLASADRQAVFKGDCRRCHVAPAAGLAGGLLFHAACGVCHEAEHRASMVPDLAKLDHPTDRAFWKQIIVSGKPGTLMPAFAIDQGGPLSPLQVDSLAAYLVATLSAPPLMATEHAQAK